MSPSMILYTRKAASIGKKPLFVVFIASLYRYSTKNKDKMTVGSNLLTRENAFTAVWVVGPIGQDPASEMDFASMESNGSLEYIDLSLVGNQLVS